MKRVEENCSSEFVKPQLQVCGTIVDITSEKEQTGEQTPQTRKRNLDTRRNVNLYFKHDICKFTWAILLVSILTITYD